MLVTSGWMLLTGLLVPIQNARPSHPPPAPSAPARVKVWTDREEPYRRGEGARVYLDAAEPAHVAVFRVDTDGRIRVLFPREPWGESFVPAGRTLEVSGSRGGRSFMVDDYPGVGYLFAVASPQPLAFDDIVRGDYWDYRLIDGGRIRGDPYLLLPRLAERITRGASYGYDIAPYYVDRRFDYPRFVCYDCHAYASYAAWDPYQRACSRYRIVVYDDPTRYPYREGKGRHVVTPSRPGPHFVFRDADPERDYVSRAPAPAEARREDAEPSRTSQDIGGPGSVPAPAAQSLQRRAPDPDLRTGHPPAAAPAAREDERRRKPTAAPPSTPERLRPSDDDRRRGTAERPARPPRSTGEPELRRRRP